jgi:hypothetical protein
MGRPQSSHLQGGANAAADAGAGGQGGQPGHIAGQRFGNRQFGGKALLIPAGEHGHGQQGGRHLPGGAGRLHCGFLAGMEGVAACCGMHGDQFGPQPAGAAAGAGHGGRDVVELQV